MSSNRTRVTVALKAMPSYSASISMCACHTHAQFGDVGRSTCIRKVQQLLSGAFNGKEPCKSIKQDEDMHDGADKELADILDVRGQPAGRANPGRDRPHSGEDKKYKSESKVRVEAKNALDNYAYNLRNSLTGEKLKETTPEADKKAVDDKVPETLQWLDAKQAAEKEEFESGPPGSAEGYGGSIENRAQLIFEVVDVVLSSLPLSQVGIWLSPVSETFGCKDSAPRETYGFDLVYLSVVERRGSTQTTRASRRTAWRTTSAAFTMEC
ncbi:hypothetical protein Pcac1_g6844 [Phytophthora cactorum]|uniref:Uncharacterized protein n=1 Tax=Phytophthora cactorum TaxID=29920 RepID=A0A8T1AU76_9STRA|nr:hypothetical protein Pcac1_g6844 [Phytophthora cactorum]KAG2888809.1 hypothetical protein PC117_g24829 [Phytophthora cactorum]